MALACKKNNNLSPSSRQDWGGTWEDRLRILWRLQATKCTLCRVPLQSLPPLRGAGVTKGKRLLWSHHKRSRERTEGVWGHSSIHRVFHESKARSVQSQDLRYSDPSLWWSNLVMSQVALFRAWSIPLEYINTYASIREMIYRVTASALERD